MIMTGDPKKNLASIVLARISKPKEDASAPPQEMASDESLKAAAEDMMQAIKDDDSTAFMMALKAFVSLADQSPEEPDQDQP